jgi:hypothetical protein
VLADGGAEVVGVMDGADHVVSRFLEESAKAFPEENLVFGDHYAHGSSAVTIVPAPGGLATMTLPPSAVTRSPMPSSPAPSEITAPPMPLSRMATTSLLLRLPALTVTAEALACFAELVSASLATK